jgi:hypothetical protein
MNSKHFTALWVALQQNDGNIEHLEGSGYGIIDVLSRHLSGGNEKNWKSSVCVAGITAEIRNENFPNGSKGIHCYVSTFPTMFLLLLLLLRDISLSSCRWTFDRLIFKLQRIKIWDVLNPFFPDLTAERWFQNFRHEDFFDFHQILMAPFLHWSKYEYNPWH